MLTQRFNRARLLSALQQGLVLLLVVLVFYGLAHNASLNLKALNIASGFGFLTDRAGYDISFQLIDYAPSDSYGRAYLVGLLNTLLVSVISIVLATLIGVLLGVGRVSENWLVNRLCGMSIEFLRNVPLVVHLIWWYGLMLALPSVRQAFSLADVFFLSNAGLQVPWPQQGAAVGWGLVLMGVGALSAIVAFKLRDARARWRGFTPRRWPWVMACALVLPMLVYVISGTALHWDVPTRQGFGFHGGATLVPELLALWLALSFYSASYIAETVRAAIQAVHRGQYEAAKALGFVRGTAMRQLIAPQALYAMVPQITNTYMNIVKNSSLGVVVGFMELVSSTGGTTLNQTGQAIECIVLVMATYCVICLVISLAMNFYNYRISKRGH
ncbi:ABC transporter permease subunit [Pseudomonas sp. Wu6]|uniref:amino acid ABC transporter permease n=1 Tax=Pseudomonas sp. Wu6 TaxID=1210129 RepID=UPI001CA69691|nr:ABC transporter permease subunit [Pseudomonas sp. Wu6]MBY8930076.1 ABC transporter permease subunit [Pseudomonas sp. Wu6]